MKQFFVPALCALTFTASSAAASDHHAVMQIYLDDEVRAWASSDTLISAIRAQNEVTKGYTQAEIDALDQSWRAATDQPEDALISEVMQNPAADYLREQVEASLGLVTEVFIMDARGLNVAASSVTSDYWQGDEDKFQKTYPMGRDATHFGELEFDDSTQSFQGQMSFTIVDPATGESIGAITVGVDASALM